MRTCPSTNADDEDMPKEREMDTRHNKQYDLGQTKLSSREVASKCVVGDDTKH